LFCDKGVTTQALEVSWGSNHKFVLTSLNASACSTSPTAEKYNLCTGLGLPAQTQQLTYPFNTYSGFGYGTCDGIAGATISFELTDDGEGGISDHFSCRVTDKAGAVVLDQDGFLRYGNHQAHYHT